MKLLITVKATIGSCPVYQVRDRIVLDDGYRLNLEETDAVCFHSQQAAEKYLKALLQEIGQSVPRTHQLMDLLALCQKADRSIQLLVPDLMALDGMGVKFRYPGETADKAEAKSAFNSMRAVRRFVRGRLGVER